MEQPANARVEFGAATEQDRSAIRELLEASGLASEVADLGVFIVARQGGEIVGSVGVEPHGADALLRSFAVSAPQRSRRLGRELFTRALAKARRLPAERVFLLTTTAAEYFRRSGFSTCRRDEVPAAIRASKAVADHCPSSAEHMVLDLRRTALSYPLDSGPG